MTTGWAIFSEQDKKQWKPVSTWKLEIYLLIRKRKVKHWVEEDGPLKIFIQQRDYTEYKNVYLKI